MTLVGGTISDYVQIWCSKFCSLCGIRLACRFRRRAEEKSYFWLHSIKPASRAQDLSSRSCLRSQLYRKITWAQGISGSMISPDLISVQSSLVGQNWRCSAYCLISSKFLHLCFVLKSTNAPLPSIQKRPSRPISAVHMTCWRMVSRQWPEIY